MFEAFTRGLKVQVKSQYLPEQSNPIKNDYVFAYHVTLTNEGFETLQLISRHWIITDGEGRIEEVKGAGVIGEQPVLEPGESFEYTSFCPLKTSLGTMRGTYQMITSSQENFDAVIPLFTLAIESQTFH